MSVGLRGVAVMMHGGGPTRVINASLAAAVEECRRHAAITGVYGAEHGIFGVLAEDFVDLGRQDSALIEKVGTAPSSALGSCRYRLSDGEYERVFDVFRAHNVRYLFPAGGNGSMVAARAVARFALGSGYELRVIGIPKTIDNDLPETDHSPGYGSAALFFASAVRDIGADNRALPGRVTVVEVMGRDVGWLVAATALARAYPDDPPHLIYLPEQSLSTDRLLSDVERVYRRLGRAVVAVSEGQRDATGGVFGADVRPPDGSLHRMTSNLAHSIARIITERSGIRARSEKPGLLGRSSGAFISETDRNEARLCGQAAVRAAVGGATHVMVALRRVSQSPYRCETALVNLDKLDRARTFPSEWILPGGDVDPAFIEYVAPLAGEVPPHARLEPLRIPRRTVRAIG
jgi:6-phosphofructokinase 1